MTLTSLQPIYNILVLVLMGSIIVYMEFLSFFLPQIVDSIKGCLDVSSDPATFIQVCNIRCY